MKENQIIISKLVEHLKLGKPLLNLNRKAIGQRTASKYVFWIGKLDEWFNKPFTSLTQEDIDEFRNKLRENKFRKLDGKPYDDDVKGKEIEGKALKTLLKFLGKQDMAMFSNGYKTQKETPALTKAEVEKVIARVKLRDKVIWQLLFDSGCRIEEFLNIRFCDIKDDSLKAEGFYKVRIIKSKTKPRTIGLTLPLSTELLNQWLDENKDKLGTSQPLISLSYRHLWLMLVNNGQRILKKRVYPHLLRHSSATYYCHYLNQYQLCKRYGWSISSAEPRRYIDREGIEDESINHTVVAEENLTLLKQTNALKEQINLLNEKVSGANDKEALIAQLKSMFAPQFMDMQKQIDAMPKQMVAKFKQTHTKGNLEVTATLKHKHPVA